MSPSGVTSVSNFAHRSAICFLMSSLVVTEVLLGGMVAVPGAFLCIARRLDFASSKQSATTQLRHTIFEALICIVLPIVYMALRECSHHAKSVCYMKAIDFHLTSRSACTRPQVHHCSGLWLPCCCIQLPARLATHSDPSFLVITRRIALLP